MLKKEKPSNNLLTPLQLGVIRDYLPWGSRRLLANEFGLTDQYAGLVLNGKRYHEGILLMALDLALKEKERRERRNKTIKNQLSRLVS